jgi:predicted transcriptional regulator
MSRQKGDIMREVLISIQPKWVSPITLGKKTVECRKNKPNCEVPFKCYIYCSSKDYDKVFGVDKFMHKVFLNGKGKGKVIGHFICDKVVKFPHDPYDPAFSETADLSCVGIDGLSEYLGHKDYGYGWHITDLVVYDEPRELRDFKPYNRTEEDCKFSHLGLAIPKCKDCRECYVKRPYQSWGYVEATEPRQTAD